MTSAVAWMRKREHMADMGMLCRQSGCCAPVGVAVTQASDADQDDVEMLREYLALQQSERKPSLPTHATPQLQACKRNRTESLSSQALCDGSETG